MAKLRNWKTLVILFVVVAAFSAGFVGFFTEPVQARPCDCYVMFCNSHGCWEECIPCPPLWP